MEGRYVGSLLGLALADALGARHEGGVLGTIAWWAVGGVGSAELRWTDDTQMALGLARSLVECRGLDPDHLAATWARDADWKRGYAGGARRMLARVRNGEDWRVANRSQFPDGSFGNGAAMRVAPLALWFGRDGDDLVDAARLASSITHAHPLGIEGGVLVARATALALVEDLDPPDFLARLRAGCAEEEFTGRIDVAGELLQAEPSHRDVAYVLGNSVVAQESAVTAVYAYLRFRDADFPDLVAFIVKLGGDTDTIGAMAGGMWGARRGAGALPPDPLARLEAKDAIEEAARALFTHRPRTP